VIGADLSFTTEGHHIIALIAMADLEDHAPEIRAAIDAILDAASSHRSIREAAAFPDVIRPEQPETGPFHFINIPFRHDDEDDPDLPSAPHVIVKIADFSEVVRAEDGDADERADALSWLIHLFGDIHQPLHCVARITPLHPQGDRGGNSFRLTGNPSNLHSLWDRSANLSQRPEEQVARQIREDHPRESLAADLAETSPTAWARASFALAKTHAYTDTLVEDPDDPPTPSNPYLRNMERVGQRQAALAGYRLADRCRALLGA
jgi:nuclease S1